MAAVDIRASPLFEKMRATIETHEAEEAQHQRQSADDADLSLQAHGWEELYDDATQATYYYSPRTGETRWDKPVLDTASGHADSAGWYYQGTEGEERGPESLDKMRLWFEHGYFPRGTLVRRGATDAFKEVHTFHEICGGAAEVGPGTIAEGNPPSVEPEPQPAVEEAQPSKGAGLEHPTATRAQRRSSTRSRTQRRRAVNDNASVDLLSSQLTEEKARTKALEAELDDLKRAHTEEKVQLQAELMRLERARDGDAHSRQNRIGAVRQPCVALFYEELPGQPSRVVPIADASELVEKAIIVDGTKVWAEGMLDWRPFREVKSQMGNLSELKAASVAATFFYELGSGQVSDETPTKELESLLVQLSQSDTSTVPAPTINRTTKVWTEGLETWKPLGEVEHLLVHSAE